MRINTTFQKYTIAGMLIIGLVACSHNQQKNCLNPSGFAINRGVNLSHWLSQDFGWAPKYTYINENDIRFIDSIGYDHVRIPIDEKEMWDSTGVPVKQAFSLLTSCLQWCAKYNLRAIVDLHIVRAHHFNAANDGTTNTLWVDSLAQKNFINLWIQLSDSLHAYSTKMVAYEILNEAVAPHPDDWNKLMNKAVLAIRKHEPERVIIIGANMWQIAPNLKYLKLPEGDKNIILSFHTYSPLAFTHYKAEWTSIKLYKGPVHYPGQIISNENFKKYVDTTNLTLLGPIADARDIYNKERLLKGFQDGIDFAKSQNLQLYCGEFGCLPTVDRKERLLYYSDLISAFEENNIAWCNWEYKGDFGIYFFDSIQKKSTQPDFELIKILLKNTSKQ